MNIHTMRVHAGKSLEVLLIALTQGCEQANVWIRN